MARPLFLVENFASGRQFSSHVLSASSTEAGLDVRFVGTGRRQRDLNRWAPSTLNADAYVQITFDRVRMFSHIGIDRDHNLGGHTVAVRVSNDGFTSYTTAASATMPSSVFPYSRLSDGLPIRTEEGAILWSTGQHSAKAVRIHIPAMGAGLKPEIVGIHIGLGWEPEHALQKPYSHGKIRLVYDVERSPEAWAAAGTIGKLRVGQPSLLLEPLEYADARYHIEELFLSRKPMWLAVDQDEAEKARYVVAPPGDAGFEKRTGPWSGWVGEFSYEESEPRIVAGVNT